MFEINETKKQILGKLTERAWITTNLADEIVKSSQIVYNHLDE